MQVVVVDTSEDRGQGRFALWIARERRAVGHQGRILKIGMAEVAENTVGIVAFYRFAQSVSLKALTYEDIEMVILPRREDIVGRIFPLPQHGRSRRLADAVLIVHVGRRELILGLIGPVGRSRDSDTEVGLDLQAFDGLERGVGLGLDEMALSLVLSAGIVHQCHGVGLTLLPGNGIVVIAIVVIHGQEGRGLEHVADVVAVVVAHVDTAVLRIGVGCPLAEGEDIETARGADEHMVGVHAGGVAGEVRLTRLSKDTVLIGV